VHVLSRVPELRCAEVETPLGLCVVLDVQDHLTSGLHGRCEGHGEVLVRGGPACHRHAGPDPVDVEVLCAERHLLQGPGNRGELARHHPGHGLFLEVRCHVDPDVRDVHLAVRRIVGRLGARLDAQDSDVEARNQDRGQEGPGPVRTGPATSPARVGRTAWAKAHSTRSGATGPLAHGVMPPFSRWPTHWGPGVCSWATGYSPDRELASGARPRPASPAPAQGRWSPIENGLQTRSAARGELVLQYAVPRPAYAATRPWLYRALRAGGQPGQGCRSLCPA